MRSFNCIKMVRTLAFAGFLLVCALILIARPRQNDKLSERIYHRGSIHLILLRGPSWFQVGLTTDADKVNQALVRIQYDSAKKGEHQESLADDGCCILISGKSPFFCKRLFVNPDKIKLVQIAVSNRIDDQTFEFGDRRPEK